MNNKEWQAERKKAKKRDKNRCRHCGEKEKSIKVRLCEGHEFYRGWLNLHHTDPKKEGKIKIEGKLQIVKVKAKELILLCPSCHGKIWCQKKHGRLQLLGSEILY